MLNNQIEDNSYQLFQPMQKLTVTQIKSLQNLQKTSTQVVESRYIYLSLIQGNLITYFASPAQKQVNTLQILKLKNQQIIFENKKVAKNFNIKKASIVNNVLGVICENDNGFYVCQIFGKTTQLIKMEVHLGNIADLFAFEGALLTAGRDMTIRIWQPNTSTNKSKNGLGAVKLPQALKGHKNAITCLRSYHKFLLSGSESGQFLIWHNRQLWSSTNLQSQILSIVDLPQSSQILVTTANNLINFIPISSVLEKKIKILESINVGNFGVPALIEEIDQSFAVAKVQGALKFIQVNLRIQVHSVSIQSDNRSSKDDKNRKNRQIDGIWCQGRCLFYGDTGSGLRVVKI